MILNWKHSDTSTSNYQAIIVKLALADKPYAKRIVWYKQIKNTPIRRENFKIGHSRRCEMTIQMMPDLLNAANY